MIGSETRVRPAGGASPVTTIPFVDLHAQYNSLRAEVEASIRRTLERGDFILGEAVTEFQREFAEYCGTRHAIGVSTGTAAIRLALQALGVGDGDEVIVPANTYIGTVEGLLELRAVPVLVD